MLRYLITESEMLRHITRSCWPTFLRGTLRKAKNVFRNGKWVVSRDNNMSILKTEQLLSIKA